VLLAITESGISQWTNISAGKIPTSSSTVSGNVITCREGRVWRGYANQLWMTDDYGINWYDRSPSLSTVTSIVDVDFFDMNIGVLAAGNSIYYTTNAGLSWTTIYTRPGGSFPSVKFVSNTQEIAASFSAGPIVLTQNGGINWQIISPQNYNYIMNIQTRRNGYIYALLDNIGYGKVSRIAMTGDYGATWSYSSTGLDYDNYSFAIDSCDLNAFFVVNEELYATTDRLAGIFVSTDRGTSWSQTASTNNLRYLCGSVSTAPGAVVFAQTYSNGVIRTTDYGASWSAIGGPNGTFDSRLVAAATKDTVFAVDQSGMVWMTTNSGGYPATPNARGSITCYPGSLFDGVQTQVVCDSLTRSVRIVRSMCGGGQIRYFNLAGANPGDYTLTQTSQDSVVVKFKPSAIGPRNADLHLTLSDGSVVIVPLRGSGIDTGYAFMATPPTLFDDDSVLTCLSLKQQVQIVLSGCIVPGVSSQAITGPARNDYTLSTNGNIATITFSPSALGYRGAAYTLVLSDGRSFNVPLKGTGADPGAALSAKPNKLFDHDSLLQCKSAVRSLHLRANVCVTKDIISQTITGAASADYKIVVPAPNPLTGDDSVAIFFAPGALGVRNAQYEVTLSDGTKISVPLIGKAFDPGPALTAVPNKLFETDTTLSCKTVTRGFHLHSNRCVNRKIASQNITGAAAKDYSFIRFATDPLTGDDDVVIAFAPSSGGSRAAEYTLVLADSTKIVVPLEGNGIDPGAPLVAAPAALFTTDSIALCTAVIRGFRIRSNPCVSKIVNSERIEGDGRKDYTIVERAPDPLSGDDSITIAFQPKAPGICKAKYILELPNNVRIDVPLEGQSYDPGYSIVMNPVKLFEGDTIMLCAKASRSFRITSSGCIVPDVRSQAITGTSACDYFLTAPVLTTLSGSDVVTITFTPSLLGVRSATYELTLSDGKKLSIPLEGYCINAPYSVTASPQTLFEDDSLFLCQSIDRDVHIGKTDCAISSLAEEKIIGNAAADYMVVKKLPDSLSKDNIVTIRFTPSAIGLRDAQYLMTTADNKLVGIDLAGSGRASVPLELSSVKDLSTDTVGGDASVPIRINGLAHAETIELSVTFDKNLEYRGTTSMGGNRLDVPGASGEGYARIRIPASEMRVNDISAYANFSVFADTIMISRVSLDSLVVLSAEAACEYITDTRTLTTVTGPSGCSVTTLSGYLRYGKMPNLEIYPNPSTGLFTVVSSIPLGLVRIEVTDKLGAVRYSSTVSVEKGGARIDASALPSGSYFVRLITDGFSAALPVVVER
jgi:photosystem II stability/assembly factor-like uncharacterized protein